MKIDPYKSKQTFLNWKESGAKISGVPPADEKIIKQFIFDLESGLNVGASNKKGSRSYLRLKSYISKMRTLSTMIQKKFGGKRNLKTIKRNELHAMFKDVEDGIIKRLDGKPYTSTIDYVKAFKSFWHWYQRVSDKELEDITSELAMTNSKPPWVYLEFDKLTQLADDSNRYYKTLIYFMIDTGLRVTEMKNIRVSDFGDDYKTLDVRDEISKVVGRNIKIMLSSKFIETFIESNELKGDDLLFGISPAEMNQYLKRKSKSLFGDGMTKAKKSYDKLSLRDLRHNSACYWLPRYPTQQGMIYRFGWKNSDKIFYYSEFLGMVDNISEGDLLIDISKTELQRDNEKLKQDLENHKASTDLQIQGLHKKMETLAKKLESINKSI